MTLLGDLAPGDIARRLAGPGLALRTGPFIFRIRSRLKSVSQTLLLLYAQHPVAQDGAFCDATLELTQPAGLRRWWRQQVVVSVEGQRLFEPLPLDQAFALLEWTMNWWVSGNAHQYLLLHAACVERDGRAVILPAPPGSGKSTLCAALVQRGWRLMSDELTMIDPASGQLWALARPVSLKNQSLNVIRQFEPSVVLSDAAHDTAKGTVAHMKPRADDVRRMHAPAQARWVVFPRYVAGAAPALTVRPKADAMMDLGRNAFNYPLLGLAGFEALAGVVSRSDCFSFSYSRLDDAIAVFDALARAASSA